MKIGIDISHWNRIIDFDAVAACVDFVIIKAGGSDKGFYTDSCFEKYYHEFSKRGVPVGAYYFVGRNFKTDLDGVLDAERFVSIIKHKQFQYPVCLDLETTDPVYKESVTAAAVAFCAYLEKHGYYAMIYASDISGFKDRLNLNLLDKYDKWVARYGSEPTYVKSYGIHQYTSKGSVEGIIGNVDIDASFMSYPDIMKRCKLNNC